MKRSGKSIAELERLVRHHNHLYFVEKKPTISDDEFDRLVEELKGRKPDSKILQEIGSDLGGAEAKVRHTLPMLSLDKAYGLETMNDWAAKFTGAVVASPKVDGVAVSIKYGKDGTLELAATRGSGVEGELVTKNVLEIKNIPQKIDFKNVEIRGEIYMPLAVFKGYSREFANPRNLAAGAIKQKDPKKTADYHLSFFGYDLLGSKAKTEAEKLRLLKENGFQTLPWKLVEREEIQSIFEKFFEKREEADFETDGVVFKANDVGEQERLGVTAHHPRSAIAYKFQGDSGKTRLIDVVWNVARSGVMTPVAIVEPVILSGATVTRASLHNYGLMKKLDLTRGAKVLMMRRGGVIPNLEKVLEPGKGKFEPPKKCPSCGSPVSARDDFLYCSHPERCVKTRLAELEHFIKVIECDGFGDKLVAELYENDLVQDPADFYRLTKADLMRLPRMGDVLAEKLVRNINGRRELTLATFIISLGIREVGRHVAGILAAQYRDLGKILKLDREELASIHSIGGVIAEEVVSGLKEKRPLIDHLLREITLKKESDKSQKKGPLAGKKILFTGGLSAMDRKSAEHLVEEKGGSAVTSISKEVDFLVVGGEGGTGSKLDKAKKMIAKGAKIRIISEEEFLKLGDVPPSATT